MLSWLVTLVVMVVVMGTEMGENRETWRNFVELEDNSESWDVAVMEVMVKGQVKVLIMAVIKERAA